MLANPCLRDTLTAIMIGSLRGTVLEVHASFFLLEVAGVGYQIRASIPTLTKLVTGETGFVYIHDHLREDAHDLFGFLNRTELDLFERLLGVSGVGPKVALTLLSAGEVNAVHDAIIRGDLEFMTSVPGVGKKTAQKIILELKGKLVESADVLPADVEVLDALQSLGYGSSEAREALKRISPDGDVSTRVREALRQLAT